MLKQQLYCFVLFFIVLYCIVFYCIVLHCFVFSCIVSHCIVLHCILLYCIALYCLVLYFIVLYCIVLYFIVLYCHPSKLIHRHHRRAFQEYLANGLAKRGIRRQDSDVRRKYLKRYNLDPLADSLIDKRSGAKEASVAGKK